MRDPNRDPKPPARALDRIVMEPLRGLLGAGVTRLLLSPDGPLNLVPFEALIDQQQRYLIERYAINYLTTGRDLLRLQVTRSSKADALVVADPLFDEPEQAAAPHRGPGHRQARTPQHRCGRRSLGRALCAAREHGVGSARDQVAVPRGHDADRRQGHQGRARGGGGPALSPCRDARILSRPPRRGRQPAASFRSRAERRQCRARRGEAPGF